MASREYAPLHVLWFKDIGFNHDEESLDLEVEDIKKTKKSVLCFKMYMIDDDDAS